MRCCIEMKKFLRAGEVAITYVPKFREYGIFYLDGGTSYQVIRYCPWCGKKLPESLREKWFDEIEKLGMNPEDQNLPKKFLTEEWIKSTNNDMDVAEAPTPIKKPKK